jgi:hypothetical protein
MCSFAIEYEQHAKEEFSNDFLSLHTTWPE